jgi:hypothetical protein
MSLHVWELREALKNADDNDEVVVLDDEGLDAMSVTKTGIDWFRSPGNTRTRGLIIKLSATLPKVKRCPDCCAEWEDDDDF